jgi:hypothetical protein
MTFAAKLRRFGAAEAKGKALGAKATLVYAL